MTYADGASLDGLQQVVDRLAARLGRSVAVDDAQGRLVVASRHFGEEDELRVYAIVHRVSDPRVMAHFAAAGIYGWTRPGRIPAEPGLGFKARVCCPIRDHGLLFGHLFLIDDGVDDADIEQATAATAAIGRLMYRRLALHEEEERFAHALATEILGVDDDTRHAALDRARAGGALVTADPVRVVVVGVPGETGDDTRLRVRAVVDGLLRDRLPGLGVAAVTAGEVSLVLVGRAAGERLARETAERLVSLLADDGRVAVAGLGAAGPAAGVPDSHAQARVAVRAAARLPDLGPVAAHEDLGPYALLLRLPDDALDVSHYPEALRRLLAADPTGVLVDTLAAYLDRAGDVTRAAADLTVHRSTLHYRLGRIEQFADVDLRSGADRLTLHLGLALRRLAAGRPPDTGR